MSDLLKNGKKLKKISDTNLYNEMNTMEQQNKDFRSTSFDDITNNLMEKNQFSMKSTFTNLKSFLKQRLDGDTNYWSEKKLDMIKEKKESAFKSKPSQKEKKALKDNYKSRQKELLAMEKNTQSMMDAIGNGEEIDSAEYISNVERLRDLNLEILRNAGYRDNTYDDEGNILTRGDDVFLETKAKYDLEVLRMKQGNEEETDTTKEEKSLSNFYKSYRGEKLTGLYWRVKENPKELQRIKDLNNTDYELISLLNIKTEGYVEDNEDITPEQVVRNRIILDAKRKDSKYRKRVRVRNERLKFIEEHRKSRLEECKNMGYVELRQTYYNIYRSTCIHENSVPEGEFTILYKEVKDIERKCKTTLRITEVTPISAEYFEGFDNWDDALKAIAKFELFNNASLKEQKIPSLVSRLDLTKDDIKDINDYKKAAYMYTMPEIGDIDIGIEDDYIDDIP